MNLLVNAEEAMPEGGTGAHHHRKSGGCRTGRHDPSQRSDEGPGVPEEVREQIFRPFVTTKTDGTGFGLAIARSPSRSMREGSGWSRNGTDRDGYRFDSGGGLGQRCHVPRRAASTPAPAAELGWRRRRTDMSQRILVVDDDASIRETFEIHLEKKGIRGPVRRERGEALNQLGAFEPSLVITDVRMPGMDGLELLRRIREGSDADVIVITAHESMESAVGAMKAGAYDYLVKPLDLKRIDHLVAQCFRDRSLRRNDRTRSGRGFARTEEPHRLVGRHPSMIEVYKLIGVLAENRATVLITGETGTGKERIARAIHHSSSRAAQPFIGVNCTAIPETLLESELFGHVRGAFTGAVGPRQGYFELAGEGTIFLDEIGDTAPEFQSKLLRVLEEGEFYPVGGERPRQTGARVMAATQTPLEERVREGRFRKDLFFRLQVVEVNVPPLRERRGDIPLLADHFLDKIARELGQEVKGISGAAIRSLGKYRLAGERPGAGTCPHQGGGDGQGSLPGRGTLRSRGQPPRVRGSRASRRKPGSHGGGTRPEGPEGTGGVKRHAAEVLKISRTRLDRLIEKHGLDVPE